MLYRLGRTHAEIKEWATARQTLDRLLAEFPDSPYRREALYLRAESALQQGDAAAAEIGFAALIQEPPAAKDPKGLIPGVRLKRIQCWIADETLEGRARRRSGDQGRSGRGDPAICRAGLRGRASPARAWPGSKKRARCVSERSWMPEGGATWKRGLQLMCGETYFHQDQLHEALRDFPQGRYSLRCTALAGRRTARSGKSL